MNAKQLKDSLLLYAVTGKLVHQNENDESAAVIVKRLRALQQSLVKEKKIKIGKFDATLSDREVPTGWCLVKLGEITSLITKQTGFDYSNHIKPNLSPVKNSGYIPMIQTKNFKGRSFDFETDYYISQDIANRFPNIMLKGKAMLLSIVGASVGNVGIYDSDKVAMIGGAICKVVLLDESLYDYVYYFLQSPLGYAEIYKNFKSTAQGTIMVQDVREIEIPLPPVAEQKRIVAKIEELLPLIDKYGKAQDELDTLNTSLPSRLRLSILQEAMSGRLVSQSSTDDMELFYSQLIARKEDLLKTKRISNRDFSVGKIADEDVPPFDIPANWKWVKVGDLFKHSTGKALNESNKKGKLYDYITTSNVYWNSFKLDKIRQMYFTEDELDKCQATKGDLLVLEGGDIGRAAIWNYDYNICLQNHIHKLRSYLEVDTKFYYYCFQFYHDCGLIGGKGIGIQGLSYSNLHELVFPLPPLAEQKRIVAKIEELFAEIDKLK